MARVRVSYSGSLAKEFNTPRFTITINSSSPRTFIFPFGPVACTLDNIAPQYASVDRPGRYPLFMRSGNTLPTLSFQLFLGNIYSNQRNVQGWINHLIQIARSESLITIQYGAISQGSWRCTTMTVNGVQRNVQNEVSQATVDMVFTRASDIHLHLGPASGGTKKQATSHSAVSVRGGNKQIHAAVYIAKAGDTLWSICKAHYGDPSKWHFVADANRLQTPKLHPGQVIRLP